MKARFERFVRSFPGTHAYAIACMLIIFIGHETAWDVPAAILLLLMGAWGLSVDVGIRCLVPQICGLILVASVEHTPNIPSHSDYYFKPAVLISAAVAVLILLAALLRFIIKHRHEAARPSLRSQLFGLLLWGVGLLFSGLGYSPVYGKDILFSLGIAASFLVPYLLFSFFGKRTKEEAEYFLFCLMSAGLVVLCELIVAYFTHVRFDGLVPIKESVVLGWGFWTHIGAFLVFALPAALWFARSARRGLIYFFIGCALFLGVLMAAGRGAMLFGAILLFICLFLLLLGGKNKKQNRIAIAAIGGCVLIILLLLSGKILAFLSEYLRFGLGDNGRFALYRLAIENFLKAPVFGVGAFTSGIESPWVQNYPYLYHDTLLQMLGGGGAFGAICYLIHRADTVRLAVIKRRDSLSLFLLLVSFAVVLMSLLDEHIFHIYPAMLYAIALYYAEGDYKDSVA